MVRSSMAVTAVLWLVLAGPQAWPQETPEPTEPTESPAAESGAGQSKLLGQVFTGDKKRVVGATVEIYNLSNQQTFRSDPTDKGGNFKFEELPRGYYDIAIFTADGMYVVNQVVEVSPGGKAVIRLTVIPYSGAPGETHRQYPGAEQDPNGLAEMNRKATGKEFWKSPKGIAILGGGGAAVLLLIATTGNSDEVPVSPF